MSRSQLPFTQRSKAPSQVPRLTGMLRSQGGGSAAGGGAPDLQALYAQRNRMLEERRRQRADMQVGGQQQQHGWCACSSAPRRLCNLPAASAAVCAEQGWLPQPLANTCASSLLSPNLSHPPPQISSARAELLSAVFGPAAGAGAPPKAGREDFERFMRSVARLLGGEASSEEVAASALAVWEALGGAAGALRAAAAAGQRGRASEAAR